MSSSFTYLMRGLLIMVWAVAVMFQVKAYSMVGLSTVAKRDYVAVSKLYDDIIRVSHDMKLTTPAIATDFIENYVLGCAKAIVSYQYEREREILRPRCVFPADVGAVYDKKTALRQIWNADIIILSLEETALDAFKPEHRDPLTHVLENYPFPKSISTFRKDLHQEIIRQFKHVGTYKIFNRTIGLYESGRRLPTDVSVSSTNDSNYSPLALFDDSESIWHSVSPPVYPQIIQFRYEKPLVMTHISLLPQIGAVDRAPLSFVLQGKENGGSWAEMLSVKNAIYLDDRAKLWRITKADFFTNFRLIIYANGGPANFVTIRKLTPLFIGNNSSVSHADK